jgi:hypothetical protein
MDWAMLLIREALGTEVGMMSARLSLKKSRRGGGFSLGGRERVGEEVGHTDAGEYGAGVGVADEHEDEKDPGEKVGH